MILNLKKVLLYINTIKYLKWSQLYFRALRSFKKTKVIDRYGGTIASPGSIWLHVALFEKKSIDANHACFLNHCKELDLPADWNREIPSKLWVYNLHYFEVFFSDNAREQAKSINDLHRLWVQHNPMGFGNGWEPYPISIRIVNVMKAWLGGFTFDHDALGSVFLQASYLSQNLERHLLGNHLFVNLKAMLFAGVIFDKIEWIAMGEQGLLKEIPEQILDDGANFELSPMYHSLILVDLLDMENLCRAYPQRVCSELTSIISRTIPKMLQFMAVISHPDDEVSFFNDSVKGVAPEASRIRSYAKKLGFATKYYDTSEVKIIDSPDSGYYSITGYGTKIIFDGARVGPSYIPGHAHADTLSFEMSIGTERVFVNSGISEYGVNEIRLTQRKTRSHNTVEVDGRDSSEVWSSFRVANRAFITKRDAQVTNDKEVKIQATHDGYKTFLGGCLHTREIVLSEGRLRVSDSLLGRFQEAVARFYFSPDLRVEMEGKILTIEGRNFVIRSDLSNCSAVVSNAFWYPQFGVEIPNKVLEIKFFDFKQEVLFEWKQK